MKPMRPPRVPMKMPLGRGAAMAAGPAMASAAPPSPAMAPPAGQMAGMKKGGMASPHHRADGVARRGHTACKMCGGGYTK